MKKQTKPNLYRPNDRKMQVLSATLFVISFLLFAAGAGLSTFAARMETNRTEYITDELCTVSYPCTITLTAAYDRSPIDIHFISPSGRRYSQTQVDSFKDDGSSIIMSLTTDEAGDWTFDYNKKNNRSLQLSVDQTYANQVYLIDAKTETSKTTGSLYITFRPLYGDGTDTTTEISCAVAMTGLETSMSRLAWNGMIPLNTTARIELDTDGLPNGLYQLTLTTGNSDNEAYQAVWKEDVTWEGLKTVSNNTW